MSWKQDFSAAIKHFRNGEHKKALAGINAAIENGAKSEYIVYDSRAAIFEKLGRAKDALKDARMTIQLAPGQWQGYARASRSFLQIRKFDSASQMANAALTRVKADDSKRREDLFKLQKDIQAAEEDYIRRTTNHWTHLPVELFSEIGMLLVQSRPEQIIPLTHVCKDWRRVIEANPHLWGTLVLGGHRTRFKAKRWVELSNGSIHTLKVNASAVNKGAWDGDGLEALRWDQLRSCTLESWDIISFLKRSGLPTTLPSLVVHEYLNSDSNETHPFDTAWPLQTLKLTQGLLSPHLCDLTETSITDLSLKNVRIPLPGLTIPATLHSLSLSGAVCPFNVALPDELPQLHALHLDLPGTFMDLAHIPMVSLTSFRLERHHQPLTAHFQSLCDKSSGLLTSLTLKSIPLPQAGPLVELLRRNPLLTSLELTDISSSIISIVEALAAPSIESTAEDEGASTLCPLLTTLDLSRCPDVRTGPVHRLIKARNVSLPSSDQEIARILKLTLDGCDKIEAGFLPWFREHVDRFSCVYWTKKSGKYRVAG